MVLTEIMNVIKHHMLMYADRLNYQLRFKFFPMQMQEIDYKNTIDTNQSQYKSKYVCIICII